MPRWASRITLEITGVCVERLQEISDADAKAEGVELWAEGAMSAEGQAWYPPAEKFERLWREVNGWDDWNANPWVWVVEFKKCPTL